MPAPALLLHTDFIWRKNTATAAGNGVETATIWAYEDRFLGLSNGPTTLRFS